MRYKHLNDSKLAITDQAKRHIGFSIRSIYVERIIDLSILEILEKFGRLFAMENLPQAQPLLPGNPNYQSLHS